MHLKRLAKPTTTAPSGHWKSKSCVTEFTSPLQSPCAATCCHREAAQIATSRRHPSDISDRYSRPLYLHWHPLRLSALEKKGVAGTPNAHAHFSLHVSFSKMFTVYEQLKALVFGGERGTEGKRDGPEKLPTAQDQPQKRCFSGEITSLTDTSGMIDHQVSPSHVSSVLDHVMLWHRCSSLQVW